MDNLFYHYTGIETFYNMLDESLKLSDGSGDLDLLIRASHCDFMNDQTEGRLFKKCLLRDLCAYADMNGYKLTKKDFEV